MVGNTGSAVRIKLIFNIELGVSLAEKDYRKSVGEIEFDQIG